MRPQTAAIGAAMVTVVLWASAFVGIRAAGEDLSAGPLTLARLLIGAVALGLVVAAQRSPLPARSDVPRLLVCGLLWFGAYNVLLNAAEQRVDAGTAAMLVNIGPVLIALLAGVVLREGFPRSLLVGCAVAFAGTIVIGLATSERSVDAGWGAMLCVGAAAAYSVAVIAQKPLLARSSALQITFLACAIGAVACLPFAPALAGELAAAPAGSVAWAVYLGIFPTAVGFTTWAYALGRTSAGKMGVTTYLVPPIAIGLGWALLGETPPALALLGGALCLVGVAITRGRRLPTGYPGRKRETGGDDAQTKSRTERQGPGAVRAPARAR
jgi:drug/metabolite transporter (DMT)-like permease